MQLCPLGLYSPNFHFHQGTQLFGSCLATFPSTPCSPRQTPSIHPSIRNDTALSSHANPKPTPRRSWRGGFDPGRATESGSLSETPKGRKQGKERRRPGLQMKPEMLSLWQRLPAPRLRHPLLFISSSAHPCTKTGRETPRGEQRGAGARVPPQGCEERWETRGVLPGEPLGSQLGGGGQQSRDTPPLQPHVLLREMLHPSFHSDVPRRLVWGQPGV